MKYMALIYVDPTGFSSRSDEEREAITKEYFALAEDPRMVHSDQLQPGSTATTVRVRGGGTGIWSPCGPRRGWRGRGLRGWRWRVLEPPPSSARSGSDSVSGAERIAHHTIPSRATIGIFRMSIR